MLQPVALELLAVQNRGWCLLDFLQRVDHHQPRFFYF